MIGYVQAADSARMMRICVVVLLCGGVVVLFGQVLGLLWHAEHCVA